VQAVRHVLRQPQCEEKSCSSRYCGFSQHW
jgi:hypothetical protein